MRPLFNDPPTHSGNTGPTMDSELAQQQLWQAKLEALAEFAAGAGHEINNPLAVIINRAQRLLEEESDPRRRRELAAIGAQAYRIRDMIGDTMLFGRPPEPVPEACDLAATVSEVAEKLAEVFDATDTTLEQQIEDCPALYADPLQLKIVISSLLQNAAEATGEQGRIRVTATSVLEGTARFVRLCVIDNGPGLSDIDREHLFDPFYSGRQAGRGLGFGLSKCWRIVDGHGGRIDVSRTPSDETVCTVFWPTVDNGNDDK